MITPKLTIGMAVFSDWSGPYFTIQNLRLNNDLSEVEILLVDNNPASAESPHLRGLMEKIDGHNNAGARYISMSEPVGTSPPRNRVFEEARGEAVACMDSHILLGPHAIDRLLDWYQSHPGSKDLLSGPLYLDNMTALCTHFSDEWRGEMWGTWGRAWRHPNGMIVDVVNDSGQCRFRTVTMNPEFVGGPSVQFHGHESELESEGFVPLGFDPEDEFDIPGQGLGLFSCRRSAWLGFHPAWRGFGGEEMQIHEKFRQAGRRCLSLGFLKWVHRFGHISGAPPYPATQYNKIRNYVIGHNELGIPLDRVHHHFCVEIHAGKKSPIMPPHEWEHLIADPIAHTAETLPRPDLRIPVAAVRQEPTIEELYESVRQQPRDLNEHMPMLAQLAGKCDHVTEFTKRRESTIALAAGRPSRLISHNATEPTNGALVMLEKIAPFVTIDGKDSPEVPEIEETDLLFLKTKHTADRLAAELKAYAGKVRRYIVLGDTLAHGETGEDGGAGYWYALRPFVAENPEWFVCYHTKDQFGLTVLSKRLEDKPAEPIIAWPPGYGPGTELSEILKGFGINPKKGCGCRALAEHMDFVGPAKCREDMTRIVAEIEKNQKNWTWAEQLAAGFKVATGGFLSIESLVEEAIKRAEIKEQERKQKAA